MRQGVGPTSQNQISQKKLTVIQADMKWLIIYEIQNFQFKIHNQSPPSAKLIHSKIIRFLIFFSVIKALKSRRRSVDVEDPAEAETYYSNIVLVLQHKIGHGVWSEVKAAEM